MNNRLASDKIIPTVLKSKRLYLLLSAVAVVALVTAVGFSRDKDNGSRAASAVPYGNVDSVNCSGLVGWAFDFDRGAQSINVDIYFSKTYPAVSGRDPGIRVLANIYRPDVNAAYQNSLAPVSGNHGFRFSIPNSVGGVQVRNSQTWFVTAYAIGVGQNGAQDGQNPRIGSGQPTINCSPTTGPTNLAGSAAGTSQINLSWGSAHAGSGLSIAGYDVFRNGEKIVTTGATSIADGARAPGTTYSYHVVARDNLGQAFNSNTIQIATAQAPPNNPPPNNPPNNTGPKPGPKTIPRTPSNLTVPEDTTPPSVPGDFLAFVNDDNKSVELSWNAATDNVAVAGYSLERSRDKEVWEPVDNNITQTDYEDRTVSFGDKYYYRLSAFDVAGLTSDFAAAEITTSSFEANAYTDSDSIIESSDNAVSLLIPTGAISQEAFCTLDIDTNTLGPNIEDHMIVSGPYVLICRESTGTVLSIYNDPLTLTALLHSDTLKNVKKPVYFGVKEDKWSQLKIINRDQKQRIDTVGLGEYQSFVIMQKSKKTSIWRTIATIFLVTVSIVATALLVLRYKFVHGLKSKYDDYIRKSKGY